MFITWRGQVTSPTVCLGSVSPILSTWFQAMEVVQSLCLVHLLHWILTLGRCQLWFGEAQACSQRLGGTEVYSDPAAILDPTLI